MTRAHIGVITDFDNTLVKTQDFIKKHIVATCALMQVTPPSEQALFEVLKTNPPFEKIFSLLFGEQGEAVLSKYRESAMETPFEASPGGLEAIARLKYKKTEIVIVSNRTNKLTERLIQATYNPEDFTAIIQPVSPKPSKDGYKEALVIFSQKGISPENIYVVDDSPDGYLACDEVLAENFFALTTGANTKEDFLKVGVAENKILESIGELLEKVL